MNSEKDSWQKKYLAPIVQLKTLREINIGEFLKDVFEILKYSILFHKPYEKPKEDLPQFGIFDNADIAYLICHELYENANTRIKHLEEKAEKLLQYISALFALISFVFTKTNENPSKTFYILALVTMLCSILVSFRCVNIKTKMEFFVPTIFNLTKEQPKPNLNKKDIAHDLLEMAIFNQNIADDIADMLKGARYFLVISIIFSIFGFIFNAHDILFEKKNNANINIENIKFN